MKSKYHKQTEVIEHRKAIIKRLKKEIEDISRLDIPKEEKSGRITVLESKISRHEVDIKNTEKRMKVDGRINQSFGNFS